MSATIISRTSTSRCYPNLVCLAFLYAGSIALTPSTVSGQRVFDLDFNHHSSERTYTRNDWRSDWDNPVWEDGVRENRISIITGKQAFQRRGASLAVHFPAGGVGPKDGGGQWKHDFEQGARIVRLRYRVKFARGFDFVRGGKLPGLSGGTAPTGSTKADGFNGFTARMMWRTDHRGQPGAPVQTKANLVQYVKHPTSGFRNDGRQEDNLYWTDNEGERIEIESGRFYNITNLVKLNGVGKTDGLIKSYLNGKQVLEARGLEFRKTNDLKIDVLHFSTFFGGSSNAWAPSKDETILFDNFQIDIIR